MRFLADPVMAVLCVLGTVLYLLLAERLLAAVFPAAEPEGAGRRRTGIIRVLIAMAPLLGLLGTVNGMIRTFRGLGEGPVSLAVADGIHAALYSTEYGLALAVPAFLLSCLLKD